MKVPLLDLKPQLESLHGEILEAVTRVVESTRYIMGPEIENLEKEIAEYCGTADAVGVSSGTDALLLSLMALDIGPGDLVLTTDFSFFATAGVISRLNATPVFLDIDPENWNVYGNRAISYIALGEYQKALKDFTEVTRLNPKLPAAYGGRAFIYSQLGEHQKAIQEYTEAIRIDDPENVGFEIAGAYANRGNSYRKLGQIDKADADLKRACELDSFYCR